MADLTKKSPIRRRRPTPSIESRSIDPHARDRPNREAHFDRRFGIAPWTQCPPGGRHGLRLVTSKPGFASSLLVSPAKHWPSKGRGGLPRFNIDEKRGSREGG